MRRAQDSFPGRGLSSTAALLLLLALGCEDEDGDLEPQVFESDLPSDLRGGSDFSGGGVGGSGGPPEVPTDDPTRMIEEADIVQLEGDRLYALSRYGGLHVIDVGTPGELHWLGSYNRGHDGEPFEMYLRDGVAMVMYRAWGRYVAAEDDDGWTWVQSSHLLVLDASDPEDIRELGGFDVPGTISDSRIVGDILYVVGYQDGFCWGCNEDTPLTSVVSLDVSDPSAVQEVDELQYEDDDNAWGWNQRTIHVTTERMYVAGIEYGDQGPVGSSIQVVDISDPGGALVEAAVIEAEGQVSNRWQMDERDGVLRVLSQPPVWDLSRPPVVQTFTVESSDDFTPLGRTELVLPRPEQLQSVRFDGDRAYAVTFERTDPLFTIDLSDPAAPVQRGELEIPGFLYFMEPRGERLLGLGFDQGNPDGAITVSLFDVSDLTEPTMLSRVNFGGEWASLPEDQDRIHKVFRVLDELGLILVPHSGWSDARCGESTSGVQLVDWDAEADTLSLRGAIPVRGQARRALVHDDQVLTISDERVESYAIADRDEPMRDDGVALTRNVTRMVALASGTVARISQDYWAANSLLVDFAAPASVESPQSSPGELVLGELARASGAGDACYAYVWLQDAFAIGEQLLLVYRSEQWDDPVEKSRAGLLVIDASDPAKPEVVSKTDWSFGGESTWYGSFYDYGLPASRSSIAHTDEAVAMLEASLAGSETALRLRVIDVRDPEAPQTTLLDLEPRRGQGGLFTAGDVLVSSHYEPVADGEAVRFFLDRWDLSDPAAPVELAQLNVPGTVLHLDTASGRGVTADLERVDTQDTTWQECAERFATYEFDYAAGGEEGACTGYQQRLHLLRISGGGGVELLDSHVLDEDQALRAYDVGDDVLFATVGAGTYWGWAAVDCFGPCGYAQSEPSTLLALSGLSGDAFEVASLEVQTDDWWGWWSPTPVYAVGRHVLVVGQDDALIVDATDPAELTVDRTEALGGYVQHVSAADGAALLSLGQYGARRIELGP